MAAGKGILALLGSSKAKGPPGSSSSPLREPGAPASHSPLNEKADALKSMWSNMKSGDFEAAALDFHDAYMACQKAEADEGADDSEDGSDAEDDYKTEEP